MFEINFIGFFGKKTNVKKKCKFTCLSKNNEIIIRNKSNMYNLTIYSENKYTINNEKKSKNTMIELKNNSIIKIKLLNFSQEKNEITISYEKISNFNKSIKNRLCLEKNENPKLKIINCSNNFININYFKNVYINDIFNEKIKFKNIKNINSSINNNFIEEKNILITKYFNKKVFYPTLVDIEYMQIINKFILVIDFNNCGGGTTQFINHIISYYKKYTTFIIARNYTNKIIFTINDEFEINCEFNIKEAYDFLLKYNDKITKIFVNHTINHDVEFLNNLTNLNKEITTITHDFYNVNDKPNPLINEINKNYINTKNLNINKYDKIITQNVKNLLIFNSHIEDENKQIIISELPDYKKQKEKIETTNSNIVIGIFGIISDIKGKNILEEIINYYDTISNVDIIIFGHCNIKNFNNQYVYHNINELNELLIKYKPNILMELSVWPETYSYTLSLKMLTNLPILYFKKTGNFVIEDRLKSYKKAYSFENIEEFNKLVNLHKQNYFYTIEPNIYFNDFWNEYFVENDKINELQNLNNIIIKNYDLNKSKKEIYLNKIKPFAIYFPQFHIIESNNKWFYNGYTDYLNLKNVDKTYLKKNNILTPNDVLYDYYDLHINNNIINTQINIATKFGLQGFAIYHYWFDENKIDNVDNNIMEKVTNKFLNVDNEEFLFFLIWANENWNTDLINNYNVNYDNWNKHFINLLKYFKDKNYYKIDNKPVFFILHYYFWKETIFKEMIDYFDDKCKQHGFNGIYISVITGYNLPIYNFINSHYVNMPAWKNATIFGSTFKENNTTVIDYDAYLHFKEIDFVKEINKKNDIIFNVFPSFNNYVRNYYKKTINNFKTINDEPSNFKKLLENNFNNYKTHKNDSKIFLINAWNEWGENMSIEPSNELNFKYLEIIQELLIKNFVD